MVLFNVSTYEKYMTTYLLKTKLMRTSCEHGVLIMCLLLWYCDKRDSSAAFVLVCFYGVGFVAMVIVLLLWH